MWDWGNGGVPIEQEFSITIASEEPFHQMSIEWLGLEVTVYPFVEHSLSFLS